MSVVVHVRPMTLPGVDLAAAGDYRSALVARLDEGDARVTDVFAGWRDYVQRHHGAVFEAPDAGDGTGKRVSTTAAGTVDTAGTPADCFADALTFDAAVRALRRAVESTFGVVVETPSDGLDLSPAHDAVDVSFVHDERGARGPDPDALAAAGADDLRRLYERTVSLPSRRVFGEYYTPPGLAALGVEEVAARGDAFETAVVVDPGCGAGAFLTAALRRKRDEVGSSRPAATLDRLTASVVGIDVNPVAVAAARTAYLLALLPVVRRADVDRVSVPVFLGDALGLAADAPDTGVEGSADVLLGNPPWIPWERLPGAQKRRLREGPIERLGLFDHEGAAARLGHANDDLSLPFAWTCIDRYLADGGVAGLVLKRDHLRGPAGRLLRSGRVGTRPLAVEHVHDFAAVDPFDGVDAAAALYLFRVGSADFDSESDSGSVSPAASGSGMSSATHSGTPGTVDAETPGATGPEGEPSPGSTIWEPTDRPADFGSLSGLRSTLARTETALRPVDPAAEASPWHRTDAAVDALGECAYRIRHGLKDDAKAVFSVDERVLEAVESTHVYPYLRSKHVVKWGLFGHDRFLVPQRQAGEDNECELAREAPATYDYLERHRDRLEARGSSWFDAGPFYSLFGLGPYTWAPYKVVWCRLGFKPHFAVVSTRDDPVLGEKPVVPGDHCMFVACDDATEAHYLCGLLNSTPYQRCLHDLAGSGKASLSKAVVSSLFLPTWGAHPWQERLARLSRRAHAVVPAYTDRSKRAYNRLSIPALSAIEHEVDAVVTRVLAAR